jgi:hypothetical protein
MYDTVAALWRHPPEGVSELVPWRAREERTNPETGEVRRSARGGNHLEAQVLLHPDGSIKVERSLPKALTYQNAVDLTQDQVPDALAAVDRELSVLAPGVPWPPFGTLDPCRVDYCRSVTMGGSAEVDLALRRLSLVPFPRKGRPVVGESGSVSWPRGDFRPKFYNKGRETGEDRYANVLRFEVGAFGSRALGHIPGLLSPLGGGELTVRDVLVPQAAEFVLGQALARVGGYEMSDQDVSDFAFLRAMVAFFGARRAFGLVGLSYGWLMFGVRTGDDLARLDLGERTTWYRARADLRRFRDHLAASGEELGDVDEVQARVAGLGRLAA